MLTATANAPALPSNRLGKAGINHSYLATLLGLLFLLAPTLLQAQDRNIGVNEVYPAPMFKENGGRFINVKKLVEAGIYSKNAAGDGVTDDSDAIIAAMDWVMDRLRAAGAPCGWDENWHIYFPNGTYLVSKPLIYAGERIPNCVPSNISPTREGTAGLKLVGQSREGVTIRLKDNAEGFGDIANKKPVVAFAKTTSEFNNAPAGFKFRNFTVNTGSGNPGAVGVDYYGANTSRLDNVKIIGSGEIGLHIRMGSAHGYYSNITINGFRYGIKLEGNAESHPSIEYVSLSSQRESAIRLEKISVSFRKVYSTNSVNGISLQKVDVYAPHLVIVDSYFLGGSAAHSAIQINQGFFFGRNVTVQGYGTTITKDGQAAQASGSIEEYNSEAITAYSSSRVRTTAVKSMNLPVEDYPVVAWVSDFSQWANVDAYGAVGNGTTDDTQAIQDAMNSGRPVVYFPKMNYRMGTVSIPASVKQVIGGDVSLLNSGIKFDVNATASQVLLLKDVQMENGGSIRHSAQRDILLESTSSSSNVYNSDLTGPGSKVFANNVHGFARNAGTIEHVSVWARFINCEKAGDFQFNAGVGSSLWIFGLKSEKVYSVFSATDGGKLEVLGGLLNRWGSAPADRATVSHPAIVNNNSHVSIIAASNGPSDRSWIPMVKDTLAGSPAKTWTMSHFPNRGWSNNIVIPLYASYDPAVIPQVPPVSLPDVVVTNVSWTPANPVTGTGVTFKATIKNQGTGATPAGTILGVRFSVDGVTKNVSDTYTTSLAAGDSVTLTANSGPSGTASWTATEGNHTVEAFVDDINRFPESDDTNNKLSAPLTVQSLSVTSFTLFNADTDQPVSGFDPIPANATIDYTKLGTTHLSIRANPSPTVGSIKFGYDTNAAYRIENEAPYTIAGDGKTASGSPDYFAWTPALGTHTLTATPYAGENATGTAGTAQSISFTVTNNGTNLAVGKPVTFSSQEVGNAAAKAVDNDLTTRWSSNGPGYPQTLRVDLGKSYSLNRIELAPYQNRAYRYQVEVSTDGTTYTQVVNRTSNTTGGSVLADNFPAVTARYVRLTVTGASNYTGGWVSINEFRVFGKELLTPNARLSFELQGEESETGLYPNPARNEVQVRYTARQAEEVQIRLLDNSGRPCLTTAHQAVKGANTFQVDVSSLRSGLYVVQLQGAGLPVVRKLVIAK